MRSKDELTKPFLDLTIVNFVITYLGLIHFAQGQSTSLENIPEQSPPLVNLHRLNPEIEVEIYISFTKTYAHEIGNF